MEAGALLAVLAIVACAAALVWSLVWPGIAARLRARRATLENLARNLKGRVGVVRPNRYELLFEIDGRPALLRVEPPGDEHAGSTRVRVAGAFPFWMRVVPENAWEMIKATFGPPDLTLGDPAFDAAYMVQGAPEDRIRAFLDPERRALLLRGRLAFDAGPLGLLVSTPEGLIDQPGALEAFARRAIELRRALAAPPKDDGVRVTSLTLRAGQCPICDHPLGATPRRCGACATPHHPECWTYFGGCSTYACRENP